MEEEQVDSMLPGGYKEIEERYVREGRTVRAARRAALMEWNRRHPEQILSKWDVRSEGSEGE